MGNINNKREPFDGEKFVPTIKIPKDNGNFLCYSDNSMVTISTTIDDVKDEFKTDITNLKNDIDALDKSTKKILDEHDAFINFYANSMMLLSDINTMKVLDEAADVKNIMMHCLETVHRSERELDSVCAYVQQQRDIFDIKIEAAENGLKKYHKEVENLYKPLNIISVTFGVTFVFGMLLWIIGSILGG